MAGETGPGAHVRVYSDGEVLRVQAGEDVLGEWPVHQIGIHALNEGFSIRAEGEEFLLVTDDDAALAEEMGIVAVSPRLARRVAARHHPEERPPTPPLELTTSRVGPIALALAGALVLVGSTFLRTADAGIAQSRARSEIIEGSGVEFWMAFMLGGVLLVAAAYILSIGASWGRMAALIILAVVVVLFGMVVSDTATDVSHLTAYGFLAGGLAVGVAVLFSGSLEESI